MRSPDRTASTRIKVLDIELTRPLGSLRGLDGYAAVQGLVRASGVPLGIVHVPLESGECSSRTLGQAVLQQLEREMLAHLREHGVSTTADALHETPLNELLAGSPSVFEGPWPSVTVAVCTRDRPADLALCLDSVSAQNYPRLDLLVVDNAPGDDSTERLVATEYPHARYALEPRPGLNWARNRAVIEAAGEIIAFTDDDVVVDPDWVRAIAAAFATAALDVMVVAGAVVPFEIETEAQLWFERYGGFTAGFDREQLRGSPEWGVRGVWHHANMAQRFTGANLAFRRRVFDEIGPFDPALDVGTPTNGGGDTEMLFRVLNEGFAVVHEPRALVRHRHRREYRQLLHQISGWGTGYTAFLTRSAFAYPSAWWVLMLLGMRAVWLQVRRLVASVVHSPGFPRRLLWTEMVGALAGPICYWRSRRRARTLASGFAAGFNRLPSR